MPTAKGSKAEGPIDFPAGGFRHAHFSRLIGPIEEQVNLLLLNRFSFVFKKKGKFFVFYDATWSTFKMMLLQILGCLDFQ